MNHLRVMCEKCDAVIRQCRCLSPAKETQYEICDKCNNANLECTQEGFNSAIIEALYSLKKSHQGRINFLEWARGAIDQEIERVSK